MKRIAFFLFLMAVLTVHAEVKLPQILSSNMVLQRDGMVRIWGWAAPGEKISVSFRGTVVKAKADKSGNWLVNIPSGAAGGPFELGVKGTNELILDNILVGDVWICSGQSNMEWPLKQAEQGDKEALNANYPEIRFFYVQHQTSMLPLEDVSAAQWQVCSPQTAPDFSAVGYFFGKKIHLETGIPIGLVNTSWGGTRIETWTSARAAETDPKQKEWLEGLKNFDAKKMAEEQALIFAQYRDELERVSQPGYDHAYISPQYDDRDWTTMSQPGLWENSPGFEDFDGIVWYRRTFELPDNFSFSKARLLLVKIDDSDIVWINGSRVGETFNQYSLPRKYDLPEGVLKPGQNTIVVRVEDYIGGGGIYGAPEDLCVSDPVQSVSLSGEWKVKKDPVRTPGNPYTLQTSALQPNQFPTLLFNAMIHPLIRFPIKGVIWYQGEANADALAQALAYEQQFRLMIEDWRVQWQLSNFSFYWVQLTSFRAETQSPRLENWPFLREAQANTLSLNHTGQACIIDLGNADDIHPRNKTDVGDRLALNALKFDYGQNRIFHGPRKQNVILDEHQALVTFDTGGSPLVVRNKYGYINGFEVAGRDSIFHYAKADLVNDSTIRVFVDTDHSIEALRFLWADNPGTINLFNQAGLPAEPFRTDVWNDR